MSISAGNWIGRPKIWSAIAATFLLMNGAVAQKLVTSGYLFNSDPTCRQIGDTFYLFTTQDPFTVLLKQNNTFFKGMFAYHALTTKDFDHWVDHGSILTGRDVRWNAGEALWDGDAGVPDNGKFYAYAPFRMNSAVEANYGKYDIGVFTAASPFGPYHDVYGAPMKTMDGQPLEGLSPAVVQGDDGSPYLIWGSGDTDKHEVMLARLKPDMTELAETPRMLAVPKKDECGNLEYFESPLLFKAGSKWYLTYVAYKGDKGASCDRHGSYVEYTTADSMYGPFDGAPRHLVYPALDGSESVQQGICQYRGEWYLAYHVPYERVGAENDHHRQVAVTKLTILSDGSLQSVYPDHDAGVGTTQVGTLTLDAYAPRREAVEFWTRRDVDAEKGLSGEYEMRMKDGSYLGFHNVDFDSGAVRVRAEVRAGKALLGTATLEVRVDAPKGRRIGLIKIDGRNPSKYIEPEGAMDSSVKGVHDIYLVAGGVRGGQEKVLFNLMSFRFFRSDAR
jgi:arabinoxylan arabinofuranohydrolase